MSGDRDNFRNKKIKLSMKTIIPNNLRALTKCQEKLSSTYVNCESATKTLFPKYLHIALNFASNGHYQCNMTLMNDECY